KSLPAVTPTLKIETIRKSKVKGTVHEECSLIHWCIGAWKANTIPSTTPQIVVTVPPTAHAVVVSNADGRTFTESASASGFELNLSEIIARIASTSLLGQ